MLRKELDILYQIQNTYPPCPAELPSHEPLYNIDLSTRTIEKPNEIVVKKDHNSTVFYFMVDRYFDYMDLSTTCCIITYTINNENYAYPVPFYDIYTYNHHNKMIIPWQLDRIVTSQTGEVAFSFKFFKIEGDTSDNAEIVYSLSTQPSKIFISRGIDAPELHFEDLDDEQNKKLSFLYSLIDQVQTLKGGLAWSIEE